MWKPNLNAIGAVVALATLAAISTGSASAQTQQVPPSQFALIAKHGDWEQRCLERVNASPDCFIMQVGQTPSGSARGMVTIAPGETNLLARFEVPIGVFLPGGLGLSIDGQEQGVIPFQQCFPDRCIAFAELPEDQIAALKKGNQATVSIFANAATRIDIPISLKGVTAAIKTLE